MGTDKQPYSRKTSKNQTSDKIRVLYETSANLFNIKCLTVLSAMAILTEVLNELGLFKVDRVVMLPSMLLGFFSFFLPVAVYLIGQKWRGIKVVERGWFRKLILASVFAGVVFISVALSFHAVLFLCVPILFSSQYGNRKREFVVILIASLILVPIGVYGSFFFGMADKNLLKGIMTEYEALVFANRLALATPQRMWELFFHYTLPRLFAVAAIGVLAFGITRRNSKMSEKQAELSEEIRQEMIERQDMQNHVIELLANVIETRDVSTGEHIIHTKQYVGMIASAMKNDEKYREIMTDEMIDRLKNAAPLHDVGKIVIPDTILLKPAKLTPEEFDKMKTHTLAGGKLINEFFSEIKDIDFLKTAEEIAVSHHEKWDGSGYPNGLKGEEIPLSARIMAIADVFDALVSVRVYKASIKPEDALNIMYSESGSHFDPDLIRIVRTISNDMISVANSLGN